MREDTWWIFSCLSNSKTGSGYRQTRFRTDSTIHDDKLVWRSGLFTQIIHPCAAPWYEIIYDLTPTAYGTPGSAGGLARINELSGGKGYKQIFTSPPLLFGAFLSLHAAWVMLQALFIGSVLYRSTMYCLNHYYLIDVVGGACLAIRIRRYSSFNRCTTSLMMMAFPILPSKFINICILE
jgi:hypothetical protein